MKKKFGFRPSPAMIVACVALFVALGGTATAVTYVVSSNSQVGPGTIAGHNPPSGKHANIIGGSVNATDLANSAVTGGKLAPNSVNSSKVVNGSLSASDTDPASIQQRVAGTCPPGQATQSVAQDGSLTCSATDGGTPGGSAGGALTGSYPNPSLGPGAVDTSNFSGSAKAPDAELLDGFDSSSYGGVMSSAGTVGAGPTTQYLSVTGVSTPSATEAPVDTLSPAEPMRVGALSVQVSPSATVAVDVMVNGEREFGCLILEPATTCDQPGVSVVPAGSTLALRVESQGSGSVQVLTGFLLTPV